MTMTPVAAPAGVSHVRLFADVLPADATVMLTAGQRLSYVSALYPFTYASAADVLLARLHALATPVVPARATAFLDHAIRSWWQSKAASGDVLRPGMLREYFDLDVSPVDGYAVCLVVGGARDDGRAWDYHILDIVVRVLSVVLVTGGVGFTAAQWTLADMVLDYWYAVLDFDWQG